MAGILLAMGSSYSREPECTKSLFLCYARVDRVAADRLAKELRRRRIDVFVDHDSTPLNTTWDTSIPSEIEKRDGMVVLLSEAWKPGPPAPDRPWYVYDEVHWAIECRRRTRGRFMLAVLHQTGFDFSWLPYGLRRVASREVDLLGPDQSDARVKQAACWIAALRMSEGFELPCPLATRLARLRMYWDQQPYFDPATGQWRPLLDVYVDPPEVEVKLCPHPDDNDDEERQHIAAGRERLTSLIGVPSHAPRMDVASSPAHDHSRPEASGDEAPERPPSAPRWHICGESGLGKTIRAHWLVWLLVNGFDERAAVRPATDEGTLAGPGVWSTVSKTGVEVKAAERQYGVVYLTDLNPSNDLLFEAERDAINRLGPGLQGLAAEIEDVLASGQDRVVFVIELDNARPAHFDRIEAWSSNPRFAQAIFLVFSKTRTIKRQGTGSARLSSFGHVELPRYSRTAQTLLARSHLGPEQPLHAFWSMLTQSGLKEYASLPLMLRWLAESFRKWPAIPGRWTVLPESLQELWLRATPLFIASTRSAGPRVNEVTARRAWSLLALELRWTGENRWTRRVLLRTLRSLFRESPHRRFLAATWLLPENCLADLLECDKVLIRFGDGRYAFASSWVRDHLMAEGLWASGFDGHLRAPKGDHPVILEARNRRMLTRQWADATFFASINFERAFDVVVLNTELSGWDGETLYAALQEWMRAEDITDAKPAVDALLNWSRDAHTRLEASRLLDCAAYVHYALTTFQHSPDASFYRSFGLPEPQAVAPDTWAVIKAPESGITRIGAPEGEIDHFFDRESPWWVDERHTWKQPLIERERVREQPLQHDYRLAKWPVTRRQYRAFVEDHQRDSRDTDDGDLPVTLVSWWHARLFAHWSGGRLPTEAEWEHACRAGNTGPYYWTDSDVLKTSTPDASKLKEHIVHDGESVQPVGKKAEREPNPFGLFDMLGNVWEWTQDRFEVVLDREAASEVGHRPLGLRRRPSSPPDRRVARGGSFDETPLWVRCAARTSTRPDNAWQRGGIRLAADASDLEA